jgi:hypothetical protein
MAARNNTLTTIWLSCQKTARKCQQFPHIFHTAATATKEEAELYQYVSTLISATPNCKLQKIPNNCPEVLKAQLKETLLMKRDIDTITTTYI